MASDSGLAPQTVLRRAPDLIVRIQSDGQVRLSRGTEETRFGPHALLVLHAFSRPRTMRDVVQQLGACCKGIQDWIDLTQVILELYKAGVLQDSCRPHVQPSHGFDSASLHIAMLNDRRRTSQFLSAIRDVVRPGDVVVDIGTGTGILAAAAAQAGARHVYAVEAGAVAAVARSVFEANSLAERITLIEGWSTQIDLPEPADVLVSEIIGDGPFEERLLEVLLDARKRLLKPSARIIPAGIQLWALPVHVPAEDVAACMVTDEALANWQSWYGVDFAPFAAASAQCPAAFGIHPLRMRHWQRLSEPVLLADIDLSSFTRIDFQNRATAIASRSGELNGILAFCEVGLSPDHCLSTHPDRVLEDNHWQNLVHLLPAALSMKAGDRFAIIHTRQFSGQQHSMRVDRIP